MNRLLSINKKPYFILLFISLILLQTRISLGRISQGTCPKENYETVIQNPTDYYNYLGKWYEVIRSKSTPFQNGTCASAFYCLNKKGYLTVANQELRGRALKKSTGEAKVTKDYNNMIMNFKGDEYKNFNFGDYRIINTDFKNYSVVYYCSEAEGNRKFELVWVLVRDPSKLTDSIVNSWVKYIEAKFGFKPQELIVTRHNTRLCKLVDKKDKQVKRELYC